MQGAARPGDGAAQAVELAQLAGRDPDQRDQVVGLPEAVDVGLAEADAAAQRRPPGGRVVDGDGRPQLGVGGAEGARGRPPSTTSESAGADPAQDERRRRLRARLFPIPLRSSSCNRSCGES